MIETLEPRNIMSWIVVFLVAAVLLAKQWLKRPWMNQNTVYFPCVLLQRPFYQNNDWNVSHSSSPVSSVIPCCSGLSTKTMIETLSSPFASLLASFVAVTFLPKQWLKLDFFCFFVFKFFMLQQPFYQNNDWNISLSHVSVITPWM